MTETTYAYHWAQIRWLDSKQEPYIQVVRTTKGREAAFDAAWAWAHKNLAPSAEPSVRYLGHSDTRTKY
ncbi:hypothetical protein AB0I84_07400 [Streptomyces spectabilis]|uniref:hypothetical protein n=1 Tax=Streptomyces spectabilis TaxID=68270 RepID=UPI0033C81B29